MTNWRFKTDRNGEPTTAVTRRMKKLGTSDLSTPEGRGPVLDLDPLTFLLWSELHSSTSCSRTTASESVPAPSASVVAIPVGAVAVAAVLLLLARWASSGRASPLQSHQLVR